MNILKNIIAVGVFTMLSSTAVLAQNKKIIKQEIAIEGVCGMCQERIENAALIKGVKMAEWNNESGILTVVYNQQKTSDSTICRSIAKAGHDTALIKADSANYSLLPACCAYRNGIKKH